MKDISENFGLKQFVDKPTRGEYLLDLVLCNDRSIQVKVEAKIADHQGIRVVIPESLEFRDMAMRKVWLYDDANWEEIMNTFKNHDWHNLYQGSVDDALDYFYSVVKEQ